MPHQFAKFGIKFLYPDNWALDEEDALAGNRSVTVFSPEGNVFWSVTVGEAGTDPARLVDTAVEALREEYPAIEVEESVYAIGQRELPGKEVHCYWRDQVVRASANTIVTDQAVYLLYVQGEDRALTRAEPVIEAMATSLLGGIKDLGFRW